MHSLNFDLADILATLPHRAPMLMLDRAETLANANELVAYRKVLANDPILQGHFPGHPVFPGVLLVEAIAQAAGLLAAGHPELGRAPRLPFLVGIDHARFRKQVLAHQELRIHVQRAQSWGQFAKFTGVVRVGNEIVAEAGLMATLAPQREVA